MTPAKKDSTSTGTAVCVLVLAGGLALWIASAAHTYDSGNYTEMFFEIALLVMLGALPLALVFAILARGISSRQRFMPPLLCVLSIAPVLALDPTMRTFMDDVRLESKLDAFNPIIRNLKEGTIPAGRELAAIDIRNIKDVPPDLLHLAASTCGGGAVMAEFYIRDAGRNRGLLFDDCHSPLSVQTNPVLAPVLRHISGSWYEMFGQSAE